MRADRRLPFALLALAATGVQSWRTPAGIVPVRLRSAARARVQLDGGTSDEELSKELNDLVFKMPRILDPQRASYEAWRERRARETESSRKSKVVRSEVVDLDDPDTEPRPLEPVPPEAKMTPIEFEIEVADLRGDEEAYAVDDIDAEDNAATDNYLDSL